jgi:diguanylate cyclase (GGDEF)-like protein
MPALLINPAQILDTYRKSDAVLIVCQNNTKKMIEIAAINDEARNVLGYSNEELMGQPLERILPGRIGSTIAEYVEFEDDQNDLLAVLNKVRNFSVKSHEGKEIEFRLRIIRGEAIDHNPWFHLVLVNEEKLRRSNAFREVLKENFKGHEILDERTNLPDRSSLIKDLELVVYSVRNKDISASFAVLDINHYDRFYKSYGSEICHNLHQHIGQICKLKFRAEDTIGTLSDRLIGLILIDAPQESARMVLNRLRWAVSISPMQVTPKEELLAQVNVSFTQIDGKISESEILNKCEKHMDDIREKSKNSIQLVVTHERRDYAERRKEMRIIENDRRKKERRKDIH